VVSQWLCDQTKWRYQRFCLQKLCQERTTKQKKEKMNQMTYSGKIHILDWFINLLIFFLSFLH